MTTVTANAFSKKERPQWYRELSNYAHADRRRSTIQILTTFIPYIALWVLMAQLMIQGYPYWMVLSVALVQACLNVRIFIIFHDCCHGSYFNSNKVNTIVGYMTGVLTFAPFRQWRSSHNAHHATAGNLDKRGRGDIMTLTVAEYKALPKLKRIKYRAYRNPVTIFLIGPIWNFIFLHRFWRKVDHKQERQSVVITNILLAIAVGLMGYTIGFKNYVLIQFPVFYISGIMGIWLFYIQHQFENVYWVDDDEWDPIKAGVIGSSYYNLPQIMHWISGNIGFHHIHHLMPRIPNYNLQQCFREIREMQKINPITLKKSLKSIWLNLFDEESQKLVGFRSI